MKTYSEEQWIEYRTRRLMQQHKKIYLAGILAEQGARLMDVWGRKLTLAERIRGKTLRIKVIEKEVNENESS